MNKPLPRSVFGPKFDENFERIFRRKVLVHEHHPYGTRTHEFESRKEAREFIEREERGLDNPCTYELKE